jgi:cytochrome c oxidase cbb3-type subunit I/II
MQEPTSMSPGSLMPVYPWLLTNDLDAGDIGAKIVALRKLGVPYPTGYEQRALEELRLQAEQVAADLQNNGAPAEPQKEIIALIAYLQRLGTDIKVAPQP